MDTEHHRPKNFPADRLPDPDRPHVDLMMPECFIYNAKIDYFSHFRQKNMPKTFVYNAINAGLAIHHNCIKTPNYSNNFRATFIGSSSI